MGKVLPTWVQDAYKTFTQLFSNLFPRFLSSVITTRTNDTMCYAYVKSKLPIDLYLTTVCLP